MPETKRSDGPPEKECLRNFGPDDHFLNGYGEVLALVCIRGNEVDQSIVYYCYNLTLSFREKHTDPDLLVTRCQIDDDATKIFYKF